MTVAPVECPHGRTVGWAVNSVLVGSQQLPPVEFCAECLERLDAAERTIERAFGPVPKATWLEARKHRVGVA